MRHEATKTWESCATTVLARLARERDWQRGLALVGPDDRRALVGYQDHAELWDLKSATARRLPIKEPGWFCSAACSNAWGVILHLEGLATIDLDSGAQIGRSERRGAASAAFLGEERVAVAYGNGSIAILRLTGDAEPTQIGAPNVAHATIAAAPLAGLLVAGAHDGKIRIYRARTDELLDEIDLAPTSSDWPFDIAVASDERSFIVGTARGAVLRFELSSH